MSSWNGVMEAAAHTLLLLRITNGQSVKPTRSLAVPSNRGRAAVNW